MFAGKPDGTDPSYVVRTASSPEAALGVTQNGHAFKPQAADHPDIYGASQARARVGVARCGPFDLLRFGLGLRGPREAQPAVRRAARDDATSQALSREGSIRGAAGSADAAPAIPLPLRFLPLMNDTVFPPAVLPDAQVSDNAASIAPARDAPWSGRRAASWPQRLCSAIAYRFRYLAAPGEHRKALRMAHTREKVVGATYVFLNAIQSDEPLLRHFAELRRQVRRLDRRMGVDSGISDESARVLLDAADRTAGARRQVRDKILSFHREELLYDVVGTDEFHRADGILLVVESRMATGIALYGHALRCLAAADIAEDAACETIGRILETVFAREAAAGVMQPREWLASAVGRLPHRTLVRLHATLSADLACGGAYQAFRDELLRIVEAKAGIPPPRPASDTPAMPGGT